MFTTLDTFALIAYLGVIVAMGLYLSRKNHDFHDYMFGGGRMPWWSIGISLIATSVSASTFLGNPAETFQGDMTYLMFNIGSLVSIMIVAVWFIPRFQRMKVVSAYELLEITFSRPVRLLAASFYTAHLLLRTGILLYGPALVLSQMLGLNIYLAICITAFIAIVYTWFGGLKAVVWTDVLQFFVLAGGGLLALWTCTEAVGGWAELSEAAIEAGKTKWFDTTVDPSQAGNFLSAGVAYIVFDLAIRGCDQQFVQRYMSCRDAFEANRGSYLSLLLGALIGLLFFWVGAALYVYFEVTRVTFLPPALGVNEIFPYFILHVLPPGLTGLLVAAIFAAAMSSLDSAVTALANTTVTDFLPHNEDVKKCPKGTLLRARMWVLFWGVIGTLAAFVCVAGEQSLLTKALFFTSLFIGPLLGLFLCAFFFPYLASRAVIIGAVLGMASLLPFSTIPVIPAEWFQPVYPLSWTWKPLVSMSFCLITAHIANLFVRSNGEETVP
ncbi:sodium:solute symporter family transporter [Acanthopleuribacter pedis]|uniref:Sodium/solute symporter n=1 Tax=Acanthopleuribacter pedis TaxID=442870 RepID=A0A8J7Q1M4_9BACT|nr:sodium/solute symporter [Acanthopleuribacter pedis]MBO1317595.1 sodium/solute symporter [Acanthopleuribacter pedis]